MTQPAIDGVQGLCDHDNPRRDLLVNLCLLPFYQSLVWHKISLNPFWADIAKALHVQMAFAPQTKPYDAMKRPSLLARPAKVFLS